MSTVQSDIGRQGKVMAVAIVVGCVVVGYVAVTWLTDGSQKQSQVGSIPTNSRGTPTQESELYSQVLDRYNREKASTAQRAGDSYLSVLSSRAQTVPGQPGTEPAASVAQPVAPTSYQPPQQVVYYPAPQSQQPSQQDQQRAKEVAEQTQGLMTNWAPVGHSLARSSADAADYAKSLARASGVTPQTQATGAAPPGAGVKIVDDFALVPASLQTDIDTDENSLVWANIPSGRYAGADVYALGYKRLTDTVDMTFTFMKWRGHSYKITAKPVDPVTMRTSLSGEVNNRYFSRIILPAFAMGLGRAGQLYEQANTQNIITPLGNVIQTYPAKPSASAVTGTIIGGIGNQSGQVLTNDAANMPAKQVLIQKGTTIGIQFIGPVLASDDVAAGAAAPAQERGAAVADGLGALSIPASQPPKQNQPISPPWTGYGQPPAYPQQPVSRYPQ